jgi:hypothetical protein
MPKTYSPVPWQRNIWKVPEAIRNALSNIRSDLVVVAVTKRVSVKDIEKGVYSHLGLGYENGQLVSTPSVIPPKVMGLFSTRNVEGWKIRRDDLPMITKTFSWETPNFGDAARYGTHTSYRDRDVYQWEYYEPHLSISTEVLKIPENGGEFAVIKFAVMNIHDHTRTNFQRDLFFSLNLLQENVGAAHVYASTATREDYIGTIALDWEVFPPGTVEEVIATLSKNKGGEAAQKTDVLEDRVKLFSRLKPMAYLRGTGGFGSYIGAQFADDLVVFENMNYGNALYVLYSDWEDISKRSRLDLLKGTNKGFDRFVHTGNWKTQFLEHIRVEMDKRNPKKPR